MNTININENWRVQYDGSQYSLERWDAGGRETRNPRTGETVTTQAKWVAQGRYFISMAHAVGAVIKTEASEGATDLFEFVRIQREMLAELEALLEPVAA